MARTRLLNTRRPLSERPKNINQSQTHPYRNPHNRIMTMSKPFRISRKRKRRFKMNNIVVPRMINKIAIF
jgi:hypothetical protein